MKHLLPVLALVAFAGVCAFAGLEASGAPEPIVFHKHEPFHRLPVDEPVDDAPMTPARAHLEQYVLDVMNGWRRPVLPTADYASVAHDIAGAALEKPSTYPEQDAVLLAAIAYKETGFAAFVDDARCNSWAWQGTEEGRHLTRIGGTCDGTRASSIFQVHADGIVVDGERVSAERLRADRQYAAGVALSIARRDATLVAYTGGQEAKARERVEFARAALARHPW
jgi:hypothetical protein